MKYAVSPVYHLLTDEAEYEPQDDRGLFPTLSDAVAEYDKLRVSSGVGCEIYERTADASGGQKLVYSKPRSE